VDYFGQTRGLKKQTSTWLLDPPQRLDDGDILIFTGAQ